MNPDTLTTRKPICLSMVPKIFWVDQGKFNRYSRHLALPEGDGHILGFAPTSHHDLQCNLEAYRVKPVPCTGQHRFGDTEEARHGVRACSQRPTQCSGTRTD